ncbi:coiled-coil domain-containing protein 170 isoform X4 [Panthera onca]
MQSAGSGSVPRPRAASPRPQPRPPPGPASAAGPRLLVARGDARARAPAPAPAPAPCAPRRLRSERAMSRGRSSGSRRLDPAGHAARSASSPAPEEIYDRLLEVPVTREQLHHYRNVAESARSDLAATLVKFECAQSELRELCKENAFVKGQIVTLEETVNVHEMEAKASRETIMRLVSEVNRAQKKAASCTEEKDKLGQDLLSAVETKEALEREVKLFQERLLAGQRVWDASKQELSLLKKSSCELEKSLEASRDATAASRNQHSSFREKVAALLGGNWGTIVPTEDAILERIREMTGQGESRKSMVSQLEARISELVEQLGNESGFHQKALQRAQKAESKLETLQGQLTYLEGELASGDVLRDNLDFEKQKYLKFLDQLSEKMKLDQMAAELGFDMRLDVVLARTEQLVRLESNAVIENKTIAHNLQRKLKTQKERLESKELHVNLLRQKIAQLEQEKQVRSALAVERDEANLTLRKLQKKVERLQKELRVCRDSNTELKAQLADTHELKIKTLEQTKAIEDLNKSRDKLEKMKEKAEKKLMSVKSELDSTEHEAKEDKERARNMVEAVTSEMKTLKKSLEEAEKREKQLVDFREVVSQKLGLNMTSLALPDYEIIKCLERLIHLHRHHFVTCACLKDVTLG